MKKLSTSSESKKSVKTSRKGVIGIVCAAVVAAIGVIAVFAYLSGTSGPVKNTLKADPDPTLTVQETMSPSEYNDGGVIYTYDVKNNVTVKLDDPGYSAYIRAAIVVNWAEYAVDPSTNMPLTDDEGKYIPTGNILADVPELGVDYDLSLNLPQSGAALAAEQWRKGSDGFYYYTSAVLSGGTTKPLILEARVKEGVTCPAGYMLKVDIAAQTVQAIGTTDANDTLAVVDAWGVRVTDGLIEKIR